MRLAFREWINNQSLNLANNEYIIVVTNKYVTYVKKKKKENH